MTVFALLRVAVPTPARAAPRGVRRALRAALALVPRLAPPLLPALASPLLPALALACAGLLAGLPCTSYAAAKAPIATSAAASKSTLDVAPANAPAATSVNPENPGATLPNAASAASVPANPTPVAPPVAAPAEASNATTATTQPSKDTTSGAAETRASYVPNSRFGFGRYAVFRSLIPSPALEAQAADEFNEIVRGAAHSDQLYPSTDARVQRVRAITDKLIPYSLKWNDRVRNWKWEVAIVRSPDIRMYCLPGGKIVVYSGLLDRVGLNDDELGMLLGHEIAHALREHARERLGRMQAAQLDSSGTIPQLFGLADLGVAPLGIGSQLLEMKYGNTDETEADVIGSEIASRAGYDPRAALTLWDKLAAATHSSREGGFIYVHPYSAARRQDIVKRLPDMLPLYAKARGTTVGALPDYAGAGAGTATRPRRRLAGN